jgi:hypothetical protein
MACRSAVGLGVNTGSTSVSAAPRAETRVGGTQKPVEEMTDDEREEAKQQRRLVIGHNKAWASALTCAEPG